MGILLAPQVITDRLYAKGRPAVHSRRGEISATLSRANYWLGAFGLSDSEKKMRLRAYRSLMQLQRRMHSSRRGSNTARPPRSLTRWTRSLKPQGVCKDWSPDSCGMDELQPLLAGAVRPPHCIARTESPNREVRVG